MTATTHARTPSVGILGCGLMGAGIAEVCARAGADVTIVENDEPAATAGRRRVEKSLDRAVASGKLTEADRTVAWSRLQFGTDWDAFADRQLVIEAIPEIADVKVEAFRRIDAIVSSSESILASNTSSIPIMRLAVATQRPENVLGLHFFNPVPVLPLVELVTSLLTADGTATTAERFAREVLGKKVIHSQDRAGFIVNALLVPYLLSAVRMLESGFATANDVDAGMVEGCAHPMGPLHLTDLIGLDTTLAVAESLYQEFKEQLYAPPPMLLRMVEAGLLGRTGRGFFEYA
jgi:3-hydroxybutyryl-CoA dehydrogenase